MGFEPILETANHLLPRTNNFFLPTSFHSFNRHLCRRCSYRYWGCSSEPTGNVSDLVGT